jgi:hypothetical protein
MAKMMKMGDIMHEIERIVGGQMIEKHDLQKGEVLALISKYIDIHYPGAIEEYEDGSHPVEYYGPKEGLKNAK